MSQLHCSKRMQQNDEIPRLQGRRLIETLTFFVKTETKQRYDILVNVYKVRVAECLRRVLIRELAFILENSAALNVTTEKPERERLRKHITLWVDAATFATYNEIREKFEKIPRAERVRAVFENEVNRLWAIEAKDLPRVS